MERINVKTDQGYDIFYFADDQTKAFLEDYFYISDIKEPELK